MNNRILRMSALLFLVCAIVAGVLGGVNVMTAGRIDEQKRLATERAYQAVLPAQSYEEIAYTGSIEGVESVSRCEEGFVITIRFGGSQGELSMVTGVDRDFRCTGISIISHKETSGLGAEAAGKSEKSANWRAQFVGRGEDMAVSKDGGEIEAIAGATITSRAVAKAAANCIRVAKEVA